MLALCLASVARAELDGDLRLWVGTGYDSNATRSFVRADGANAHEAQPDVAISALGSAEGRLRGERGWLAGGYDLGVRGFLRLPSENVLIQSAALEGGLALDRKLALSLDARGKDRRGGARDYTDLLTGAALAYVPDPAVELRVRGGAHRFLYWIDLPYSFSATELGFSARYRFDRRHSVVAFGDLGLRRYMGLTHPNPDVDDPPEPTRRADQVLTGGLGYTYRGPFALSITYSYTEQVSNSFGETILRHRLTATGGTRLPWRLMLLGQVAFQLSHYPDGVFLSSELNIGEDDDAHNSLSAKLVRPLSDHLDAELRYALYQDRLPQNGLTYLRQLGWVGMTWRL